MDEVKFKRVMSISASRILNTARYVEDGDITQEEFFKIMFILASLEEAQWDKEKLKIKAKSYLKSLSGTALEELEKTIVESQEMYINYWDLIEKQIRSRNKYKNKGKEDAGTTANNNPAPTKKENDDRPIYKTLGQKIILMPRGREELKKFGIADEDMQEFMNSRFSYYDTNNGAFDGMFTTEEIVQDYRDYQEDLKKSYPAAPPRGK